MRREELRATLRRIRPGIRLAPGTEDEAVHFMICPSCGQALDKRDLFQVFHHDEPGHEPLPVN